MDENVKTDTGEGQKMKKEEFTLPLLTWLAIGVVVGLLVYLLLPTSPQLPPPPSGNLTPPIPNPPAAPKITNISVTFIDDPDCPNCNSSSALLSSLSSALKGYNLTLQAVTTVNRSSAEAQALISKYSINKTPTFMITSKETIPSSFVSVWSQVGTSESDGTLVLRTVFPPYFDLAKGKVVGNVNLIEIPASKCPECFNVSEFVKYLSGSVGMVFSSSTNLAENSSEAAALISKYNITRLPVFIMSEDASAYTYITQTWSKFGTVETDGSLVYRSTLPPYYDLGSNRTVGLVSIVELVDQNCTSCYNVSIHHDTLKQSLGMYFSNRTTYDINSTAGAALVSKYNISQVPTIVLSSDALVYPGLNESWTQMGSVENDSWLVFRSVDKLGVTYKDLATGNVTTGTPAPTN